MRAFDGRMEDMETDSEPGRGMGRGAYRGVESHSPEPPPEPRDLTLGMTALLGIFLAAVLVCAVFFGFGYSTGRTLHGAKSSGLAASSAMSSAGPAADASPTAGANQADAGLSTKTTPPAGVQPAAKPSAGAPMAEPGAGASARAAGGEDARAVQAEQSGASLSAMPRSMAVSVAATHAATMNVGRAAAETATPVAGAGAFMVQIAAVMRQGDADMLARALRGNGYSALVRTEPQDKFLHVQIGPFATRDQAKAMRARLQGDGYNAFLKP